MGAPANIVQPTSSLLDGDLDVHAHRDVRQAGEPVITHRRAGEIDRDLFARVQQRRRQRTLLVQDRRIDDRRRAGRDAVGMELDVVQAITTEKGWFREAGLWTNPAQADRSAFSQQFFNQPVHFRKVGGADKAFDDFATLVHDES